jgi:hypothetical protein
MAHRPPVAGCRPAIVGYSKSVSMATEKHYVSCNKSFISRWIKQWSLMDMEQLFISR